MSKSFLCKIASLAEMNSKWEYEIAQSGKDRENWLIWKEENLEKYKQGHILLYYGILDGQIICEATAIIHPQAAQNSDGLVDSHTVYLSAFRTIDRFRGKGISPNCSILCSTICGAEALPKPPWRRAHRREKQSNLHPLRLHRIYQIR